jgi:peptidoglycan hydrolase CwlO-like protein
MMNNAPSYGQLPPSPSARPGLQNAIPLTSDNSVEELVESVIDEKWNELVKDLNKIIDWKNASETRLTAIEQQFKDLKDQFDRLHAAIVGKINDYDKNIQDVGAEIKAMEKVFSKVLPAFTDNVSELSRITDRIRAVGGSSPNTPRR